MGVLHLQTQYFIVVLSMISVKIMMTTAIVMITITTF